MSAKCGGGVAEKCMYEIWRQTIDILFILTCDFFALNILGVNICVIMTHIIEKKKSMDPKFLFI